MQQFAPGAPQGFAPPQGFMPQTFPPTQGFPVPPQGFPPTQGFAVPPGFPPQGFVPQSFPPTQGAPIFGNFPPPQGFPPTQNVPPTQIIPLMPASNFPTSQAIAPITCIYGLVNVFSQPGLVGATNGTITPFLSSPIPITQVVGPAGGMIPLNAVNGQFALLCGRFQPGPAGCQLNVSQVVPFGLPTTLSRAEFGGNIGASPASLQAATQPATLPSAQTGGM